MACSLLDLEGFLMPRLSDLVRCFPHTSLVEEKIAVLLHSVSMTVSFLFYPLISKS